MVHAQVALKTEEKLHVENYTLHLGRYLLLICVQNRLVLLRDLKGLTFDDAACRPLARQLQLVRLHQIRILFCFSNVINRDQIVKLALLVVFYDQALSAANRVLDCLDGVDRVALDVYQLDPIQCPGDR